MKLSYVATIALGALGAQALPTKINVSRDLPTTVTDSPSNSQNILTWWGAKNDYPYSACGQGDNLRFPTCQCTSFVAWRLLDRNGYRVEHENNQGQLFVDANTWDDAARKLGFRVDNTPEVGSLAHTDAGPYGHVAWVTAVQGDTVYIEDYNSGYTEGYRATSVSASTYDYIHFPKLK